jgi:hypothetical protein
MWSVRFLPVRARTSANFSGTLDNENPHAETGIVLTNVSVRLATASNRSGKTIATCLGMIPPRSAGHRHGRTRISHASARITIIWAAAKPGAMNRKGEEGQIHYGADDNASGIATLLELADALTRRARQNPARVSRGVIFAAWAGEEIGILGSSRFARKSD